MLSISQAIDIINNRRNRAELKVFYTLEVLHQDKLFSQLDTNIRALSFEIAKRESLNISLGNLKYDLEQTQQAYESRLKELGYAKKDIQEQYFCKRCNDTGFIGGKYCSCLTDLIYESINDNYTGPISNIDNFSKVDTNYYNIEHRPSYKNTLTQLNTYTKKFPNIIPFLLLMGDTGTGKTFMASIVNNILAKKGYSTLFLNACDLNDIFLKYHLADIDDKQAIFAPLIFCDLLIIDDLGSENILNNVTTPYLYKLIINRHKKNTIITTNLDPDKMAERYTKRVSSRLLDKNIAKNVTIQGIDLRHDR